MTRPAFVRSLSLCALLLAAGAPALAAQDVVEAGRAHGIAPPADLLRLLQEDSTAFEFRRAWRQKTQRVRVQRAALERREGPRLSVQQLAAAQAAVTGTMRVPVLLGLYAGATAPYSQADYQTRLFGPQQYSARTYYQEVSRGVFTLDGTVSPWVTLPQNAAYYQPNSATHARYGRTGEYLQHTLQATDAQFNFGQYDNDGADGVPNSGDDDGYVDAAAFVYPDAGMSCGGPGIWPHRWVYSAWWGAPYTTNDARAGGGFIRVDDYLIQGGLECGTAAGLMQIGTFSHEMGHALGLPDLYDTYAADGTSSGLGEWDLMASGNWRTQDAPAHMGAWSKDFLGWVNVETVTASRAATLPRVYAAGTVLRYDIPGTPEYFLMENRGAVGSDRNLRRAGLLIYHVDPAVIDSTRGWNRVNGHPRMGVALEQADGLEHLAAGTNRGDTGDPFPGASARTTWGDAGTPGTRSNGGAPSGLELRNIAVDASTGAATFNLVAGPVINAPALVQLTARTDTAATASVAVSVSAGTPGFRASKARGSAWLAVSPDTGALPQSVTITARGAGLVPGVYRDTLVFSSSAAVNSPVRTAVEFTVRPGMLVPGDSAVGQITRLAQRDTFLMRLAAGDVLDFGLFDPGTTVFTPAMLLVAPTGATHELSMLTTGGRAGVRRGRIGIGHTIPTAGMYRVVVHTTMGTGAYVLKVRRAGPVPRAEPAGRMYVPVPVNGAAGRDTLWVANAGTGTFTPVVSAINAPWLAAASASAAGGGPRPQAPSGPALAPPGIAPAAEGAAEGTGGGAAPVQPAPAAGATPVVLAATRGGRLQGDYTGFVAVSASDGWAGPAMVEVRMRVHEREVVFLTPDKMASRPVAIAVAPEGDLGVVLVDGQVLRMDPRTGATRPWATTTTSAWWGMSFGPDSAAYIAEFQRVTRVARNGTTSVALAAWGTVYDVVMTPAGDLYAAADEGLWRVPRGGTPSLVFRDRAYGVAYNPADGMIYAALQVPGIRRVNPATGTVTATLSPSDGTTQQQLEIGAGGVFYGRSYYLDQPDLRRLSATGQLDRGWWTPQPFPQAMALAPDGALYGTAGDRVFRLKVEGTPDPTHRAGDATGDDEVTAQDALAVLASAVGRTLPPGWTAAWGDANCDGQVTAQDALIILSFAVGRDVAQFCVGQPQP